MEQVISGIQFDILKISESQGVSLSYGEAKISGSGSIFYSGMFPIKQGTYAFKYKAASEGSARLKLELEQGFEPPATAGAASDDWKVPDGASEFNNTLTDENVHIKAYPPCAAPYARFKITGNESNDASTTISELKGSLIK